MPITCIFQSMHPRAVGFSQFSVMHMHLATLTLLHRMAASQHSQLGLNSSPQLLQLEVIKLNVYISHFPITVEAHVYTFLGFKMHCQGLESLQHKKKSATVQDW